jgi:hypothetical protein
VCLVEPTFQLLEDRQASFLTTDESLFIAGILEVAFDAIQFVDHSERDIGATGLPFGLHLLRFDEFTPDMRHARQSFNARL